MNNLKEFEINLEENLPKEPRPSKKMLELQKKIEHCIK